MPDHTSILGIPSSASRATHRLELDGLVGTRFLAALSVVFFHYGQSLPIFTPDHWVLRRLLLSGPEAVSYFFCLSGFIMATVYGGAPLDLKQFAGARLARIYPVYLLAFVFTLYTLSWEAPAFTVWLGVLLLQSWVPGYAIDINPPAWSLSTEAFFYLSFPWLLSWLQRRSTSTMLVTIASVWLASQIAVVALSNQWSGPYPSASFQFWAYSPVFHINAFVAGMVAALVLQRIAHRLPRWADWRADIAVTLAVASFAGALLFQDWLVLQTHWTVPFTNGMLTPFHTLVIGSLVLFDSRWSRVLGSRLFVFLGGASYAVYILQLPMKLFYESHVVPALASLGVQAPSWLYLALLVAVSALIFYSLERPMRAGLRHMFGQARATSGPAVVLAADRQAP
jgi:peptidoglycan/LPS O-acetylase OafA/YrhL